MAEINNLYTEKLKENVKPNSNQIISLILHSIISKHNCKTSRQNFILSGQNGNSAENRLQFAKEYVNCHSDSVKISRTKPCEEKYNSSFKCLEEGLNAYSLKEIPVKCAAGVNDLINCVNKH